MCGRYLVTAPADLVQEAFRLAGEPELQPTWNAAPTQHLPVVRATSSGRQLDLLRWGLVPSWAKDLAIGSRMINARSETAAEKPSFRVALARRRCLVVTDGFYEWKRDGDRKRPFCIRMADDRPFGLAGLWESWTSPEEESVETFTILTTTPTPLMAELHDR
ncbi:MAG: SOS response-associated peptidase, partial [Phycisphaerales bacterium]|nr:SOS response-associated peptidase [Phycisphaerales bacterium]